MAEVGFAGTKCSLKHHSVLKGAYCAQEGAFPFAVDFRFEKCQIILAKRVKNLLLWRPRKGLKQWGSQLGAEGSVGAGGFALFHWTNKTVVGSKDDPVKGTCKGKSEYISDPSRHF